MLRRWTLSLVALVAVGAVCAPQARAQQTLKYRWVYCPHNLQSSDQVAALEDIMRRAAKAGYTGIVLADYKLSILKYVQSWYATNAADVVKLAKQLNLDLIPSVFSIGWSAGLLANDPNLAEGFPVQQAVFKAHHGAADIVPDSTIGLKDGDFEQSNGNTMTGWAWQDMPGVVTFADTTTKHSGKQSLLIKDPGVGNPSSGNGRIQQTVAVKPYRQVDLSVWIKTSSFQTPGNIMGLVLSPSGNPVSYVTWSIAGTQDWTQYHAVFNTLNNTNLLVYFGVWGGGTGNLWFDDSSLKEVGLINIVRRTGCPLAVTSADGATQYVEGQDFKHVRDPLLGGANPLYGTYDVFHTPPKIRLTATSRIKEGQSLLVSYYHAETYYQGAVACCMTNSGVYKQLQDQFNRVQSLFNPPGYFMSHDELREMNWCDECQATHETPGQLLAANVHRCYEIIHKGQPKAHVFVWSDMFDPYHNAHNDYYLDNGDLAGSWNGLNSNITIVNWHQDDTQSMSWFTGLGNKQILAGYYDGDPNAIKTWLGNATGQSVDGVMYTTWINNYTDLEAFAKAAWGH